MKRILSLVLALALALFSVGALAETMFVAGVYEDTAKGFGGDVTVTITVSESEITDVTIVGDAETPALGGVAIQTMPEEILKAQTPNVDVLSGATVTSNAIITAATKALEAAGADIAAMDANRKYTAENGDKEEKTLETEIVIVGAGGAGMAAAIMAHQAGKQFVILKKCLMWAATPPRPPAV